MNPYYQDASVTIYHGAAEEVLPALGPVDVVLTDPPYSAHVHAKHMVGASVCRDGFAASIARNKSLGFDAVTPETMVAVTKEFARLARRWVGVFCNVELVSEWSDTLTASCLQYVRTGAWVKLNAAPQFTGDRPAPGFECIVLAHPPGKKRWNGGGHQGLWTHAIELNRGGSNKRLHTTQKPLPLMSELVALFTDPGEVVLDLFGGSGTTARACKDLGRQCILIERQEKYCEIAAKRMGQEVLALTL